MTVTTAKCVSIGVLACFVSLAGCADNTSGKRKFKIYIETDLEGASGVYKFTQTRETDTPAAREAREYLMGDIAAVVRGLRDGGATEILIIDGHGNQTFIPHLLEPGAKYLTGLPRTEPFPYLDETYDGLVQLGLHGMMGTQDAVLHHTQNSRTENRYWYNGVESGEIAQNAAIAGYYNIPTILVTGDEATCREATKFLGPECVTVAVKKGIHRESAILYPFAETRKALYEGAKRAMANLPKCKPYKLATPVQVKKQRLEAVPGSATSRPVVKEGTVEDVRKLLKF